MIGNQGTPQSMCFLKSGNLGAIVLWNNSDLSKYFEKKIRKYNFWIIFAVNFSLETMSLKRTIMEQCKLCPSKLWSKADLPRNIMEPSYIALQNHRTFILCQAKFWSNAYFDPQHHGDIVSGAKITTKVILKLYFILFFLFIFFVNQYYFRDLYNHWDYFLRKKYFLSCCL